MPIQVTSPGWRVRAAARGGPAAAATAGPGLPPQFLTDDSHVSDEVVLEAVPTTRGKPAAVGPVDLRVEVEPDRVALLAVRHPSGALTFHRPVESTTRGLRGPSQARFQVTIRTGGGASRGLVAQAAKAIVVTVAKVGGDKLASLLLPKLVEAFEKRSWSKRGLKEGWLHVSKDTLAARKLVPRAPVSPERSLLFIHGTFTDAVGGFEKLVSTNFFERAKATYDDRIFAFNHFSLQRTPDENARMLLEGLPEHATTFDVITHSRGGLVLRTLIERARDFGALSKRFALGRAVLVAAPNNGTPLATPDRWDHVVGWLANLLELFPDNPFTIGAEFVANGLVWFANHASGDIPGLHAMDSDGDPIHQLQSAADPPPAAYSALVANYHPPDNVLRRLLDVGLDQFFAAANDLVVPSQGGWSVFHGKKFFVPAARIGCFGPGGNLPGDDVSHCNFFSHQETADFLVAALEGRTQPLATIDPRRALPDRRLSRGAAAPAAAAPTAPPARRPRAPAATAAKQPPATSLRITVMNGDLSFIPQALLLGHYASSELTGTEDVMNRLVGCTMGYSLALGSYPLAPGTHQVFVNRYVDAERGTIVPRPAAVIVVGLGAEGALQPADLVRTIRLGVVGWARRLAEEKRVADTFELAATLVGSGGTGISAGQSAQLIAQGVLEANLLLERGGNRANGKWPRCSHLELVELYLDRASEAWRALQMQHAVTPDSFVLTETVQMRDGGHRRTPDLGYRGAPYDFITVDTTTTERGTQTFEYNLDTRRARSEVRGKSAQIKLLRELVSTASNDQNRDERVGRTISSLLVPLELESYLAGAPGIQMSLDPTSAAIPWELLDIARSGESADRPWSICVKLLRKLKLERFRERVVDADDQCNILVIGEPECPPDYPRLEGARAEAQRVYETLKAGGVEESKLTKLFADNPAGPRPDAQSIANALFEKSWRIVHIAGHGAPGDDTASGGVVLSNGTFLSADEIESMRTVPELVFVNCCFLAQVNDRRYDRATFASGIAGALITIGVRCIVAAGWAVDDDAAAEFASTFYDSLMRGERFIDAVGDARFAAWDRHRGVNTWAAYQCYGDPDWRYRAKRPDANQATADLRDLAGIATDDSLRLELDRIYVDTRFRHADRSAQISRLQALEQRFGGVWGGEGSVAEGFGRAYGEAGAMDRAISWYERAVRAGDGSASMRAAEQLGNAQSRFAWELVEKAVRRRDEMRQQVSPVDARKLTPKARAAARAALQDAERRLRDAIAAARPLLTASLDSLRPVALKNPSVERQSLVGSALKRRALVNSAAGRSAEARRDFRESRAAYAAAVQTGRTETGADLHYPASNCLALDLVLGAKKRKATLEKAFVSVVDAHLRARAGANADFWSEASRIELEQYQAISVRALARRLKALNAQYEQLRQRATSGRMWASVYDNAYLVLAGYGQHASKRERAASTALLERLRSFAHPNQ
jgi:CHAT domain-containing protein